MPNQTTSHREVQTELRDQLRSLLNDYKLLGRRILEISDSLIDSISTPLPSDQELPIYEMVVPETSDKANLSIGDLRFWDRTGATIIAIKRGEDIHVSPGPYAILRAGDVLVYAGPSKARLAVYQLFTSGRTESTLYLIQEQINKAVHMKELSVVMEILGARLGDITDFVAVAKGMTNHSYFFSCLGERYILRVPGEGTIDLIDRKCEAEVYRAIAGTDLCDDPVYINADNGLKVTRFLDGVRTCDPFNEDDLIKCMALLRRFHHIRLKVSHTFDIFDNINYYESFWRTASMYDDYDAVKAKIFTLRPFVASQQKDWCLTHIDAVPDNFLFYPIQGEDRLQLIDWEYAGMQDPHVDIAMFCLYSHYNRAQVDHLIDIYFEGACDRAVRAKIYCYISICGLLWSNWAEYKRQLGIEFGDYARQQYMYANMYYDIAKQEIASLCEA